MLEASYEALIIDEYQDCVEPQHDLILAIASTLPTVIFGDPLQGLISFDKTPLPNWEQEVISRFPPCEVEVRPWRWEGGNTDLGNWLLEIRGALKRGLPIDLRGAPVTWIEREPGGRRITAACLKNREGTVVALGRLPHDCAAVASRLRGQFVMMEELQGNFLLDFARIVDGGGRPTIATETLQFARNCAIGVADAIDRRKRERLAAGKSVRTTKSELGEVYQRVCGLLDDASPGKVREALLAISRLRNFRLYRHEAWRGVLSALEHADRDPELTVHQAVVRVRNGVRIAGRRPERRVVARPLLVKGLEYDHAVLLNADLYKTAPELYVALSRARRSVCVISRAATLTAKTG